MCIVALAALGSAHLPGRGPQLLDAVKLEADIPYAGTDNLRQRLKLLPKTHKDDRDMVVPYN